MCSGCSGDYENDETAVPYEPMLQQEIADLSREAGRELTEEQAQKYLRRKSAEADVMERLEKKMEEK